MTSILAGYIAALSASMLWSINPGLINKFSRGYSPLLVNFSRNIYGSATILLLMIVSGDNLTIDYTGLFIVYLSALFGPLLGDVFYIASIKRIGGGNAVAIGYTYIFYAQFFSSILYGEKLYPSLIIGSIIALLGVYIVYSGEKHVFTRTGLATAFAAAISWGLGATLSKAALNYGSPLQIAFYRNILVAATTLPLVYGELKYFSRREIVFLGVVTGGLGFGVGMPLFLYAIREISVASTVLATALTPVIGRILARVIAGEKPSVKAYIGTVITVIGIVIGLGFKTSS